jgi:uncharacterized phage infection (PIP) family protein YhgE
MARDKLITIRIEGEKRDAFNQLAKSQNTDTASLLYDFISGCLDSRIDISLVTEKGQRIDNQLDDDRLNKIDNRIDKLETTTQRIDRIDIAIQRLDNRIDGIETTTQRLAKRLDDWIEAFDDRLNDCDQGLSNKITSLEHRLNALSIQLDSQQDSQQLDRIDTDSQGDSQGEPLIKEALKLDYLNDQSLVDAIETQTEDTEIDESAYKDEPDKGAIGPVTGDSSQIEPGKGEGMNAAQAFRYVTKKGVKVSEKTLSNWVKLKEIPITDKGDNVSEYLILRDKLYYPIN